MQLHFVKLVFDGTGQVKKYGMNCPLIFTYKNEGKHPLKGSIY